MKILRFVSVSLAVCLPACGRLAAEEPAELPATLSLSQAVELLEHNNLTVLAARYGVDGARAARLVASYTPNPTLTVGGEQVNTNRRLHSYTADTGTASNPTYTFRVDQMLETGRKKSLRVGAAEMSLAANEAQVLDAVRTQTAQLKQVFFGALLARENLKGAREILESIEATETLMGKLSKGGNIAELDLIKFQANKIQFERDVQSAQVAYEQALRDLANILAAALPAGKPDGSGAKLELQGSLDAPVLTLGSDELQLHVDSRPDVVTAQRNVDAAEKNVALARAQRWSDVTVGGEYQRVGSDNTVGVVLSVPLPLYNNHKGNIQQAESQRDTACVQLKQTRLQARTDIAKAYEACVSNRKIVTLYDSSVLDKARKTAEITRKAYENKSASMLDLLDAQRTYKQTLQAFNQARFDLLNSLATLESAAGVKLLN